MDLCRQSIVFEDVAGVAACLVALRADPDARVLRVKNRLDPAYDARSRPPVNCHPPVNWASTRPATEDMRPPASLKADEPAPARPARARSKAGAEPV